MDSINFNDAAIVIYGPMDIPDLRFYQNGWTDRIESIIVKEIKPTLAVKAKCCQGLSPPNECGKYVAGSLLCKDIMGEYCSTNMRDAKCQSWCKSNTEICDNSVIAFCNKNPTHPYCTCIKSPAQTKGLVNPKCVDAKCLNTGYLTTAMKNTNCPNIVDCSIVNTLNNTGVILNYQVPIQQNCGGKDSIRAPITQPPPIPAGPKIGTSDNIELNTDTILLFLIIFIVFIAVLMGIIYFDDIYDMIFENTTIG